MTESHLVHENIISHFESLLGDLTCPAPSASAAEICRNAITAATDYTQPTYDLKIARAAPEGELSTYSAVPGNAPDIVEICSDLWCALLHALASGADKGPISDEHMTRIIDFVQEVKKTPTDGHPGWTFKGEPVEWQHLPTLGWQIRDFHNYPLESIDVHPTVTLSPEGQAVVAGCQLGDQQRDDLAYLVVERNRWLSLQAFVSRLWRDVGCQSYSLYALWALRPALENWPAVPPSFDQPAESFEKSPAYLAFQVEAATIWIINTAPLMYSSDEIWGQNGNPNWSESAGRPGKGGARWDGVDGYDAEHKRWRLWKTVLEEVARWCDEESAKGHMKEWKVRGEIAKALDAMAVAERV